MGNDLTFWRSANEVSNALSTVVNTYRLIRSTRKKEMLELTLSLEQFKRESISRGAGQLVRINIEEIAKTQKYINECNLSGVALDLAMDQLHKLNDALEENLRAYRSF